jgi:carbamoyl-phosphate synthase large subunit
MNILIYYPTVKLTYYQTAVLFAQCMSEKLPKKEGIPSEVRPWSDFIGGRPL